MTIEWFNILKPEIVINNTQTKMILHEEHTASPLQVNVV
jgi:hypothetical protein